MNTINFQQTGGFPFETDTLNAIQSAYSIFNALGELAGDKTIISGCTLTGSTVSDGVIYLNGEVLEFRGGLLQSDIIITEETVSDEFENGQVKVVYKTRYAHFGTSATKFPWSHFKRVDPLLVIMQRLAELEKKTAVFQEDGGMLFWNKPTNQIPAGWHEVTDWRGRMPVGLDVSQVEFNTLGKEGGTKEVALTEAQMPIHNHTGSTTNAGGHTPTGWAAGPYVGTSIGGGFDGGGNSFRERSVSMNAVPSHSHGINISNKGGDQPHSNLSPYRVVLFIEYIN